MPRVSAGKADPLEKSPNQRSHIKMLHWRGPARELKIAVSVVRFRPWAPFTSSPQHLFTASATLYPP